MTIEQIEAQIEALEEALAMGVETVRKDGRTITYRSTTEMERALAYLKRKKAALEEKPMRFSLVRFR